MLILVTHPNQFETVREIRNMVCEFMTRNQSAITAQEQAYFSAEYIQKHALGLQSLYLFSDDDHNIIGYGMIANCGVYSFLTGAIAPAYQGKGNGRQLFEELIAKCKGEVMLDVWASNVKAYNLYKRLGFRQSFERKVGDDYIITMYKI